MGLEDLVSHATTRWMTPPALFAAVYACFAFLDDKVAPEFRDNLVTFLRGGQYQPYIEMFPEFIQELFERVFGKTHLSFFCIRRSVVFSIGAVLLTFLFSGLYQPDLVFGILPAWGRFWDLAGPTFSQNERLATLGKAVHASWKYIIPLLLGGGWLLWCIVPDYLALLRVRVIVLILRYTKPSAWALLIIALIDFIIGVWIFLAKQTSPASHTDGNVGLSLAFAG